MEPDKISVVIGPLNLREDLGKIELGMTNPGIGGTEFQLLYLALALASNKEFDIEIICTNNIPFGLPTKIKATKLFDVNKLKSDTILISPVSTISKIKTEHLLNSKIILSSHHPHDELKRKISKRLPVKLIRVVGAYSYFADPKKTPTTYIPDLFLSKVSLNRNTASKHHISAGSISSYHPSKGTHHVIQMFNLLCKQIKGLRLELVGSSALYSNSTELRESKFKTSFDSPYKVRINKLVGRSQLTDRDCEIKEFGLQSDNLPHIVSNWSFAIINPLGIGESDPGSIKDCLALSVPVFSTGDFGTWDYQRHFSETTASSPLKLIKQIATYLNEPDLQREIQSRIISLTKELTKRNLVILEIWRKTILSINRQDSNPENYSTVFIPTIISNRMFKRITIRKFLYKFPGYGTLSNFIRDRYWSDRLRNG